MSRREAPSRIVPRVFAEDSGGQARPAKCVLCGDVIRKNALKWAHLPTDPEGVRRPLHAGCLSGYMESMRTSDLPGLDVTPTL